MADLRFTPLCSDYATLLNRRYGADSDVAGIVAYVHLGERYGDFLSGIVDFFGGDISAYPVIFTRQHLDKWNEDEDFAFLSILAHELAHWLDAEVGDEYLLDDQDDEHGPFWAIYCDLLEYLFTGEYTLTSFYAYHPRLSFMAYCIERAVTEYGIMALDTLREGGSLAKKDVIEVAAKCLKVVYEAADAAMASTDTTPAGALPA